MLTCFLFIQSSDQNAILSLRLDQVAHIDQPLKMRSIEEIRTLQENARTVIVFPTEWCGLHQLELPLLPDRKVREAIPYALEDELAQPVTQLHFAFDKAYYHNGRYLVVVIDKQIMTEWMAKLTQLGLSYDVITLDWFALGEREGCVLEQNVLINAEQFQGALSLDVWTQYAEDWTKILHWQIFADSAKLPALAELPRHVETKHAWIATRLSKAKILNLCQGAFQHATSQTQVTYWYRLAGMVAAIWLVSFIGIHAGLKLIIAHKTETLDQQIKTSYQVFFPGSQQVISPKIRIAQLLKHNQLGNNATLWSLVETLSLALTQSATPARKKPVPKLVSQVQSLQFQNQVLTATFRCNNFSGLAQIESFLQNRHVHVHQVSAATEDEQVVAKLELSL